MFIKLLSYTGTNEPQTPVWINIKSISSIRPYENGASLTKVTYNTHQSILVVSKPETIIEKIGHFIDARRTL